MGRKEESNSQSPKHLLFLAQITGYTAYLCACQGPVGKRGALINDSSRDGKQNAILTETSKYSHICIWTRVHAPHCLTAP